MIDHKHALTLLVAAALLLNACTKTDTSTTDGKGSHTLLGNPSKATANASNKDNFLMEESQYILSYNENEGKPNWVSWHLNKLWIGNAARQDDFRQNGKLPAGFYQVTSTDYTNSGFDRGHYCPSADRTATVTDNSITFFMTNMCPQAPNLNRTTWENLESYCRKLVADGNELYITMGSYGRGGTGSNGSKTTLANGKITVPDKIWKIIVVLKDGNKDLERINSDTRVIAVNMPNDQTIGADWGNYRVKINDIETATGYNILDNLSTTLQNSLEAKIDDGATR